MTWQGAYRIDMRYVGMAFKTHLIRRILPAIVSYLWFQEEILEVIEWTTLSQKEVLSDPRKKGMPKYI